MLREKIDKLTKSIEEVATGHSFDTDIVLATAADIRRSKSKWIFDWHQERNEYEVYKLVAPKVGPAIQGLMSLHRMPDHVHVNLLESNPQNVGRRKKYDGVAGNLVAYAAKLSLELGFGGAVSFDAKSELISHYEKTLKAKRVGRSQRMVIEEPEAMALIEQYFGDHHGIDT